MNINSQKLNIMVTAAGSAISLGIIKSIKASNLNCKIITTDNQRFAAGLYRGDAAYLVPLSKSPDFIDKIIDICKKENIHGICIGTDYELLKFAENRNKIEKETGAKVFVSSPEMIKIADDKWLTHQFLVKNNFPSIPSVLYKDVDILIKKEGFPLIVKPRISDSSKDIYVVKNKEELNEKVTYLLNTAINEYLPGKIEPIIQKFISDKYEEVTSSTIVFNNKSFGVISMVREMKFGGHTTKAIIKDYPEINNMIKKIAETFNPNGPCNFQSKIINGVPHIFEINCRFSGTIGACSQLGFNTVEATINKLILDKKMSDLKYKKGLILRYFNEIFIPFEELDKMKTNQLQNPVSEVNNNL